MLDQYEIPVNKEDLKKILFMILTLLVAIILISKFRTFILSILLIAIGSLSIIWKRFVRISLGFELITFISVIFCFTHGPYFAIVAAIIMTVTGSIINGRLCIPMFVQIFAYALICLLFFIVSGLGVVGSGIILALFFNIIIHSIYIFIFGFNPINSISAFVLNMIVNIFVFIRFSESLLRLF